jgi:hypothetical protein
VAATAAALVLIDLDAGPELLDLSSATIGLTVADAAALALLAVTWVAGLASSRRRLPLLLLIGALSAGLLLVAELADFAGRRFALGAGIVLLQIGVFALSTRTRPAARR